MRVVQLKNVESKMNTELHLMHYRYTCRNLIGLTILLISRSVAKNIKRAIERAAK